MAWILQINDSFICTVPSFGDDRHAQGWYQLCVQRDVQQISFCLENLFSHLSHTYATELLHIKISSLKAYKKLMVLGAGGAITPMDGG